MKIFLTGATGQVGFELLRSLAVFGEITAPNITQLDLSDLEATERFLKHLKPELIVNAAAWTAVDAAESEQNSAFKLNKELPDLLANYSSQHNIPIIHYSTDYVYPGTGSTPWNENSETNPLSIYGASKLAGDSAIINSGAQYLIFRTSWVYSARENNFMKTMLKLGEERDQLSIIDDQVGSPTSARLIAEVTALAVNSLKENKIDNGVYHLVSQGQTNWHQFAKHIFLGAKGKGHNLKINPDNITAITTADYPTPATRPLNSRLNIKKLEQSLNIKLPSWQSQLTLTLNEYLGD